MPERASVAAAGLRDNHPPDRINKNIDIGSLIIYIDPKVISNTYYE